MLIFTMPANIIFRINTLLLYISKNNNFHLMKPSAYFLLLMFLIVVSCSQTEKRYVARVKLRKLNASEIFDKELVYDVIFDSQELKADSLRNESRQLFLKGIDLYKNKKDPSGAVSLFKQSILIFPDAKTYFEMGNALMENNSNATSLKEALNSFEVAAYLNFKPASSVYYKMASAKNQLRKTDLNIGVYSVVSYLEMALDKGFSDTLSLVKDENLKSITYTNEYKDMLLRWKAKSTGNSAENMFLLFKTSFEQYPQPFEIGFDKITGGKQSISYEFADFIPEMENTSFGREVSHDYFYVAKVAETPEYTAVLYSSVSFWEGEMQPVHIKLVTYDKEGKIIAGKLFAGQFSAEKIKTGKINNNEITLQDYKRIWKYPIDQVSFEENEVEKYELVATATFKLDDKGKIVELSVPANYSDSIVFAKK
jgi:hypothetical protein